MSDYSYYTFTGQVIKIIAHTGSNLMFVLKQSMMNGDTTFMCQASGAVARYLSGRIKPGDSVFGTANLQKGDKTITLFITALYKAVPGWGGSRIKAKKRPPAKKSILYNPE